MFLFLLFFTQVYAELKWLNALRSPEGAIVLLYGDDHQPAPKQIEELQKILSIKTDYDVHVLVETCPILDENDRMNHALSLPHCKKTLHATIHDIECRKKIGGFLHLISPMNEINRNRNFKKIAEDATYRSAFNKTYGCNPEEITFENPLEEYSTEKRTYLNKLDPYLTPEAKAIIDRDLNEAEIELNKLIDNEYPDDKDTSVYNWIQLPHPKSIFLKQRHGKIGDPGKILMGFTKYSRHIVDLRTLSIILDLIKESSTILAVLAGGGHTVALKKYLEALDFQSLELYENTSSGHAGLQTAQLSLIVHPDNRW